MKLHKQFYTLLSFKKVEDHRKAKGLKTSQA